MAGENIGSGSGASAEVDKIWNLTGDNAKGQTEPHEEGVSQPETASSIEEQTEEDKVKAEEARKAHAKRERYLKNFSDAYEVATHRDTMEDSLTRDQNAEIFRKTYENDADFKAWLDKKLEARHVSFDELVDGSKPAGEKCAFSRVDIKSGKSMTQEEYFQYLLGEATEGSDLKTYSDFAKILQKKIDISGDNPQEAGETDEQYKERISKLSRENPDIAERMLVREVVIANPKREGESIWERSERISYSLKVAEERKAHPSEPGEDDSAWRKRIGLPDAETWIKQNRAKAAVDRYIGAQMSEYRRGERDAQERIAFGEDQELKSRKDLEDVLDQGIGESDDAYKMRLDNVFENMKGMAGLSFDPDEIRNATGALRKKYDIMRKYTDANPMEAGETVEHYRNRLFAEVMKSAGNLHLTEIDGEEKYLDQIEDPASLLDALSVGKVPDELAANDPRQATIVKATMDTLFDVMGRGKYPERQKGESEKDYNQRLAKYNESPNRFPERNKDESEEHYNKRVIDFNQDCLKKYLNYNKRVIAFNEDRLKLFSESQEDIFSAESQPKVGESAEAFKERMAIRDRAYVEQIKQFLFGTKNLADAFSELDLPDVEEEAAPTMSDEELRKMIIERDKYKIMKILMAGGGEGGLSSDDMAELVEQYKSETGKDVEIPDHDDENDENKEDPDKQEVEENSEELEKQRHNELLEQIDNLDTEAFADFLTKKGVKMEDLGDMSKISNGQLEALFDEFKKGGEGEDSPSNQEDDPDKPKRDEGTDDGKVEFKSMSAVQIDLEQDYRDFIRDKARELVDGELTSGGFIARAAKGAIWGNTFKEARIQHYISRLEKYKLGSGFSDPHSEKEKRFYAAQGELDRFLRSKDGIQRAVEASVDGFAEFAIHEKAGESFSAYKVVKDKEGNTKVVCRFLKDGKIKTKDVDENDVNAKEARGLHKIIADYCRTDDGRDQHERDREMEDAIEKLKADLLEEHGFDLGGDKKKFTIDNYKEIAMAARQNIEHGLSMDAVMSKFELIHTEQRRSVRTEEQFGKFEGLVNKAMESRLGRWVPPEAIAIGAGVVAGVTKKTAWAVGGLAASATLSGMKEYTRTGKDAAQIQRRKAKGEQFEGEKLNKRTAELVEASQSMFDAEDMISSMNNLMESYKKVEGNEEERKKALLQLQNTFATAEALVYISDNERRDMISYGNAQESTIEDQRLRMDIARAECAKLLRDGGVNSEDLAKQIDRSVAMYTGEEPDEHFDERFKSLKTSDKAIHKLKRNRAIRRGIATGLTSVAASVITTEGLAFIDKDTTGALEHLLHRDGGDSDNASNTLLANLAGIKHTSQALEPYGDGSDIELSETEEAQLESEGWQVTHKKVPYEDYKTVSGVEAENMIGEQGVIEEMMNGSEASQLGLHDRGDGVFSYDFKGIASNAAGDVSHDLSNVTDELAENSILFAQMSNGEKVMAAAEVGDGGNLVWNVAGKPIADLIKNGQCQYWGYGLKTGEGANGEPIMHVIASLRGERNPVGEMQVAVDDVKDLCHVTRIKEEMFNTGTTVFAMPGITSRGGLSRGHYDQFVPKFKHTPEMVSVDGKAKEPEETKPEETKPEETKPEETKPEGTVAKTATEEARVAKASMEARERIERLGLLDLGEWKLWPNFGMKDALNINSTDDELGLAMIPGEVTLRVVKDYAYDIQRSNKVSGTEKDWEAERISIESAFNKGLKYWKESLSKEDRRDILSGRKDPGEAVILVKMGIIRIGDTVKPVEQPKRTVGAKQQPVQAEQPKSVEHLDDRAEMAKIIEQMEPTARSARRFGLKPGEYINSVDNAYSTINVGKKSYNGIQNEVARCLSGMSQAKKDHMGMVFKMQLMDMVEEWNGMTAERRLNILTGVEQDDRFIPAFRKIGLLPKDYTPGASE